LILKKSDREEIAERGERGGKKVAGGMAAIRSSPCGLRRTGEGQKGIKNGELSEPRTGVHLLILHRRDWNAAEIDSESLTGKRGTWGIYDLRFTIYDFRVVGEEGEGRSFAAKGRRWMAGIEVE